MLRIIFIAVILGLANGVPEAPTPLTITAIKRVLDITGTTKQTKVEFNPTFKDNAGGDIKKVHLQIDYKDGEDDKQISLYSIDPADSSNTFEFDLNELKSKPVSFVLTTRNANDGTIGFATVQELTLPDFFEDESFTGVWVGDEDDVLSLRINENTALNGFRYKSKVCTLATGGLMCYFVIGKDTAIVDAPTEFCHHPTQKSVDICDLTVTIEDKAIGGATVTSAELKYPESGDGEIVIDTTSPEIVVYKKKNLGVFEVLEVCTASTCNIGSYKGSTDTLEVLIVEAAPDPPKKSIIIQITDYEVVGTALSSSLIETRWTRNTDIGDTYKVSRTTNAGDENSFHETTVTCKNTEKTNDFHCFAYFTGLLEDKIYALTVNDDSNDPLNQITLTDTTTLTSGEVKGMELKISSLDTKWHKGLRSFEINTCVHHAEASELSSYEAILINKRGQWKKIHGVTQRMENELCFDALHLNIYNFDLSEDMTLVVLKRGTDGITVLESTETNISVGGNGLATALRNSSSGAI